MHIYYMALGKQQVCCLAKHRLKFNRNKLDASFPYVKIHNLGYVFNNHPAYTTTDHEILIDL